MCDDCASLFSNGTFRNMACRHEERSAAVPEAMKAMQANIEKLNITICDLATKVDAKPQSANPPSSPRLWPNLNRPNPVNTPKRRRGNSGVMIDQVDKPIANRGTKPANVGVVKTVTVEDDLFWIYLSAFEPRTTKDEMIAFVSENLHLDPDSRPQVVKLVPRGTDLSKLKFVSFKVGVKKHLKDVALSMDSWPDNIEIREFKDFSRTKNVTRITGITMDSTVSDFQPPDERMRLEEQPTPL